MNRKTVTGFLERMENERNWTPATRNQRLGCIRSFFRYVASVEPTLVLYLEDLNGIPLKKGIDKSRVMEFMSQEAVKVLLQQPDTAKKSGIRDMFFMVLMYDTAARDCEMLGMRLCDLDISSKTIYLIGKGSKPRLVPVTDNTINHFQKYIKVYHEGSIGTEPMFYTIHRHQKSPMSDDNVARFIKKYCYEARKVCPEVPENVHPHMFRRSRAMHLYRSGMPLALLAEWLGHENPETTLIYAYADTEMKRKAIEKASENSPLNALPETGIWENDEDIIRRLCGLM
jgi:site-specific recombinase XerD